MKKHPDGTRMTLDRRLFLALAGFSGTAAVGTAILCSPAVSSFLGGYAPVAAALVAVPMLGACWSGARGLTRPLRALTAASRTQGQDQARLDPLGLDAAALSEIAQSPCEVGRIARAMCRMSHGMRHAAIERDRLNQIINGIADLLLVTDVEGRIIAANRSLGSLTTIQEPSDGQYFWDILRCEDVDLDSIHQRLVLGEVVENMEIHLHAAPGMAPVPALLTASPMVPGVDDQAEGYLYVLHDISERRRLEEEVLRAALYDELTNLPNRAHLMKRLREISSRFADDSPPPRCDLPCILFLDLDRFKKINDSLGHSVGDELLQHIARRLDDQVRGSDLVARLGGDEFVVLLCDVDSVREAEQIATRILAVLAQPFGIGGRSLTIGASIGLAWLSPAQDPAEVLTNADIAMYRSKARGGQVCTAYCPSMRQDVERLVGLESGLRTALAEKAFEVVYQPIVGAGSGQAAGLEALVRWRHPQHGLISPKEFMPLAMETGLMASIGRIVWQRAMEDMRGLIQRLGVQSSLFVSLNISAAELFSKDFSADFLEVLKASGLPGHHVVLEITEAALVEQPDRARRILQEVKAAGVRIALDDFGTGFSSLNHVATFPLDMLKIDKSFIAGASRTAEGDEIARGAASLARNMRLWLVAEGVEDLKDFDFAMNLPCDYYQGYFFAAPQPITEMQGYLQANRHMQDTDAAVTDTALLAARDPNQRWKM